MKEQKKERSKPVYSLDALGSLLAQMQQDETIKPPTEKQIAAQLREAHNEYRNPTYVIASTIAYLIGVEKNHFENPAEPPMLSVYEALDKEKDNRIIRDLCMLRTVTPSHYNGQKKAKKS